MVTKVAGVLLATLLALGPSTALLAAQPAPPDEANEATRGLKKPTTAPGPLRPYRKTWALVIGIDYRQRDDVDRLQLPTLRNAERDARAVAEALRNLYGFESQLLIGPQATHEAILAELAKLRSKDVQGDDALFVYFAGHGARNGSADDAGMLYPHDVRLEGGRAVERYVKLQTDLVAPLESSTARHKLIVLDSCHSGEVFSRSARPASPLGGAVPPELLAEPVLQALASCRGSQVAADGIRNEHSPFTSAFLRALQRIPARQPGSAKSPFPTSRLFISMRSDLKSLRGGQAPDCRRLVDGEGEFLFWPDSRADFTPYADSVEDFELLQAMIPGEHGKWWFDETPWFIPSLRRMILQGKARVRLGEGGASLSRDQLLALAEAAVLEAEQVDDPLVQMRAGQFRRLRAATESKQLREEAARISSELTTLLKQPGQGMTLEAPDVHLLAVVQHFLAATSSGTSEPANPAAEKPAESQRTPAAEAVVAAQPLATYAQALELYEEFAGRDRALTALCRSDLGNYLLEERREWLRAAKEFEGALVPFRDEAANMMAAVSEGQAASFKEIPPAFHIYTLCRQADAWQRQNRWGEADRCLEEALAVAQNLGEQRELMAVVHKRRAWSHMEQWRIAEAQRSFQSANRLLTTLARRTPRKGDGEPEVPLFAPSEGPDSESPRTREFAEVLDYDYDAAIDYLHNQHGLAMASRFQGRVQEAAESYRWITARLAFALTRLSRQSTGRRNEVPTDVEARLVERLINTQERLGDCNLFGDPVVRDLKEAADDYRRALGWADRVSATRRDTTRAALLFKQALAVAAPSSIQDVAHARFLCDEAEEVMRQMTSATPPPLATLAELAPSLVRLCAADSAKHDEDESDDRRSAETARMSLRQAIAQGASTDGNALHRDQLELLLFASRMLVELSDARERHQTLRDADRLLGFCRQTLLRGDVSLPSVGDNGYSRSEESSNREIRSFLRPYYDCVMRTRIAGQPKQVKDLLEIHWEATRGTPYVKSEQAVVVLALYVLDGKGWLFLDVPRGSSKFVGLDGQYSEEALRLASGVDKAKLPLPLEIVKELAGIEAGPTLAAPDRLDAQVAVPIVECWWQDPVRGLGDPAPRYADRANAAPRAAPSSAKDPQERIDDAPLRVITRRPQLDDGFPFALPGNLRRHP